MSAGSNNIVIQIVDQVDPAIAAKISGIGQAAAAAQSQLNNLKTALSNVNVAVSQLNQNLPKIPGQLNPATQGTNRFTSAIAQLISRVVGAEAGMGMLGGAFGRVGVAAGLAGPLIVAGLAVAAIVGAILVYENFDAAARKLIATQTEFAKQTHSLNDTILEQHETLVGLTEGPLAKYKADLADLPFKGINVDITNINKLLEDQKSKFATLLAAAEQYAIIGHNALVAVTGIGTTEQTQTPFTIQQAQDFIANSNKIRAASNNQKEALEKDLVDTGAKLTELNTLEKTLSDKNLANTEVSRKAIQDYYNLLTQYYSIYLGKKAIAEAGAAGDTLALQRKLAAEQLKEFNDELSQLKDKSGVIRPQDVQALRQAQLSGASRPGVDPNSIAAKPALPLNQDTIKRDIANATEAIDRQKQSLQELTERYAQQTDAGSAYSDQLKIESETRKAEIQIEKIKHDGDPQTLADIQAQITASVESARVNQQLASIYGQFQEPLLRYNAALEASAQLVHDGAISSQQKAVADAQATRALEDAVDPLNEYKISLQSQVSLLGEYGRALTVATEIEQLRQQLQKEGYDLDKTTTANLTQYLTLLESQKQIQSDLNQLWEDNAGAVQKLVEQQTALNEAVAKGVISSGQYKIATAAVNIALADQHLKEQDNVTLQNQIVAGIGKYISGYQGLAKGISDAYGQAFETIANGAADSLGRAIAFGENLGDALKNVAREAVAGLISAFIKLGIQWLITEAIGKTVGASATAATVTQAGAAAAAWAPAAAFASLATLGANAAPADAAIAGTVALSDALALVKFAGGGPVLGPGGIDKIPAMLTNGEYVINAAAASRNRPMLDAINSGASAVNANSAGGSTKLSVEVIHDGSTGIQIQQVDENTVRVIAKYEAKQAVQLHAPGVISTELANPNSRTSKAVNQNLQAPRKR